MPYIMKKHTKNISLLYFHATYNLACLLLLPRGSLPRVRVDFTKVSSVDCCSWTVFDRMRLVQSRWPTQDVGGTRAKRTRWAPSVVVFIMFYLPNGHFCSFFFKHVCRYPYLKLKFLLFQSQCSSHDAFKDHRHHIITWLYSNFVVKGLFTLAALTQAICHSVVISLHIFSAMLYRGNYTLFWSFPVTGGEQDCFEEWEQNCSW